MNTPVLAILILAITLVGFSMPPAAHAIEQPDYTVVHSTNEYELREYDGYLVAETQVQGARRDADGRAFRILANYIFGANSEDQKMAMTAPVISTPKLPDVSFSNKIEADPVEAAQGGVNQIGTTGADTDSAGANKTAASDAEENQWLYQFVMEKKFTLESLPQPEDERVKIKQVPPKYVAAHRFSGGWRDKKMRAKEQLLLNALEADGITILGEPILARYNGPFTPSFLRRNEVLIEVEAPVDKVTE